MNEELVLIEGESVVVTLTIQPTPWWRRFRKIKIKSAVVVTISRIQVESGYPTVRLALTSGSTEAVLTRE
jgi:hypothetical protein